MNNATFALNHFSYDQYDTKKFTKYVKTKKFVNENKTQLSKWADRLTTANIDKVQVIGGMLQSAFGVNIGRQIEDNLVEADFAKVRANILNVVYDMNIK